jgi:ABC-2 type transport system ATP-binding protein
MAVTCGKPGGTAAGGSAAIEISGLRKSFGDHVVLDGIDLSVPAGSVFALLGPNGAGKTTMVRILATLSAADAGDIRVAGHDIVREPMAVRSVIGVIGQFSATDAYLSAEENLLLMADLWHLPKQQGRERSAELLRLFDLADTGSKPVFTFSGGMQRRLDLAMTLMGSPRIIFLDEPTAGLDPRGRRTMWDLIRSLVRNEAVTIFLTTQYLEEADQLADLVAVLDHGEVVAHPPGAPRRPRRGRGCGHQPQLPARPLHPARAPGRHRVAARRRRPGQRGVRALSHHRPVPDPHPGRLVRHRPARGDRHPRPVARGQ